MQAISHSFVVRPSCRGFAVVDLFDHRALAYFESMEAAFAFRAALRGSSHRDYSRHPVLGMARALSLRE